MSCSGVVNYLALLMHLSRCSAAVQLSACSKAVRRFFFSWLSGFAYFFA